MMLEIGPVDVDRHHRVVADVFGFDGLVAVLTAFPFPVAAGYVQHAFVVEFQTEIHFREVGRHAGVAGEPENGLSHNLVGAFVGGEFFAELCAAVRTVHGFGSHEPGKNTVTGAVRKERRTVPGLFAGFHVHHQHSGNFLRIFGILLQIHHSGVET